MEQQALLRLTAAKPLILPLPYQSAAVVQVVGAVAEGAPVAPGAVAALAVVEETGVAAAAVIPVAAPVAVPEEVAEAQRLLHRLHLTLPVL